VSPEALVTVLMAVHNGERHLQESIDSILAQTFEGFELLAVDDASTDATPRILAGYSEADARLRVVRNEQNLGLTRSLNLGLRTSRGRYVARQDADDVSAPDRLARQTAFLEANSDVTLVASSYVRIREDGSAIAVRPVPTDAIGIRWRLLFLNAFAHSSVMFRRDAAERLGGFRAEFAFAQDYDLWSQLAWSGAVAALPEPLVQYREAEGSMTATIAGAVDDVDRISRNNMRRLGSAGARVAERVDREAAWRLLLAGTGSLTLSRAVVAARDIVTLERAFARSERLPVRIRLRRRAALAVQLARSLAPLAARRGRRRD
jgi:hypothetical protein